MYRHIMHVVCAVALSILSFTGMAQAVSLGKIDVASHLGEPFYAEVPLGLKDGESIGNVFVSLATGADYRLLEVFHDAAVDAIKVNIKRDQRGSRVELSSLRPLDLPFFNVIMKVKQGRATHFKKFSVFLDLPKAASQAPQKQAAKPLVQKMTKVKLLPSHATPVTRVEQHHRKPVASQTHKKPAFWARTQHYGPMVFGDTITTVAQRLRIDQRFSTQQVMLALFEKNQSKFGQKNINLIKAGTYLDVPTADEVMQHNNAEAVRILRQHAIAWGKLTKQRRYAKVKEAQKNRYAKHVVMGEEATGVAKHPEVIKPTSNNHTVKHSPVSLSKDAQAGASGVQNHGSVIENATLSLLKKENTDLKKHLNDLEAALSKMSSQPTAEQAMAASTAQVKRLEIQLARQNGALQKAQQAILAQQGGDGGFGLLTWILVAVVTLLSILIGYLVYMLKGKRQHPVEQEGKQEASQYRELEEDLAHHLDAPTMDEPSFDGSQDSAPSDAFDGIPDLTDEDTSEMEAFQNPDEEPDPNVDYLSEADVYTRYGMDDEAEKQVNMALRLREDNKDAHIKRVEIRHARGDQAGVKEALEAAKLALAGTSLAMFMTAYEALGNDGEEIENESEATVLEDAAPDIGEFDLPDLSNDEKTDSDELDSDELDLGAMNWSAGDLDFEGSESSDLDLPNKDASPSVDALATDGDNDALSLNDFDADVAELTSDEGDVISLADDNDATVIMDVSDDLNLDDLSLSDFDSGNSDLLAESSDVDLADLSAFSIDDDSTEDEVTSLADDNEATVMMDASDDLNLDDLSLSGFDADNSDLLAESSDVVSDADLSAFSVDNDNTEDDVTSLADDNDATVIMDTSDDLNLDDLSLSDFDADNTDLLVESSDEVSDADLSTLSVDDVVSLTDDNEATVMMDASDDLNLDDLSLSDFDSDNTDLLVESSDEVSDVDLADLSAFSVDNDNTEDDVTSLADDNDATVIMDTSDDLNLDNLSLSDFDSDNSDLLAESSDVVSDADLSAFSVDDVVSLADDNDATVIMDASDDLNLDDLSLSDFDSDNSDLLDESSDVVSDADLSAFSVDDVTSLADDNDATVIMDASNDLNLDDLSLSDFDSDNSDLLAESSDVVSNEDVTLRDEQLLTAFSDLDLGEFEHVEDSESSDLDSVEVAPSVSVDTSSHEQNMNDLTTKMSALDGLASGLQDDSTDVISPDLDDFDDLEIDLDAVDHDADLEEFTSTIQATLKELGVDDSDLDEDIEDPEDTHTLDADFDDLNLDVLEEGNLNTKGDFDASLELDSLLNELDNFSMKPNHE